eukprot:6127349-Alexandrium_andersonii.AAC.1
MSASLVGSEMCIRDSPCTPSPCTLAQAGAPVDESAQGALGGGPGDGWLPGEEWPGAQAAAP